MKSGACLLAMLVTATALAHADAMQDDIARSTAVPYPMARVAKINVKISSASDDDSAADQCRSFRITPKKAAFFLNNARPISERARIHDLTVSPCHALGTVTFVNGSRATWTIMPGGAGLMTPTTGRFKGQVVSLYCKKCDDMDI